MKARWDTFSSLFASFFYEAVFQKSRQFTIFDGDPVIHDLVETLRKGTGIAQAFLSNSCVRFNMDALPK